MDPRGEENNLMEVVHARCAGLDVSKKDAKVCVRVAGAGRRKTVETVTTGHDLVLDDQSGPRCGSTWSPNRSPAR